MICFSYVGTWRINKNLEFVSEIPKVLCKNLFFLFFCKKVVRLRESFGKREKNWLLEGFEPTTCGVFNRGNNISVLYKVQTRLQHEEVKCTTLANVGRKETVKKLFKKTFVEEKNS